jgi:hypothetical protein
VYEKARRKELLHVVGETQRKVKKKMGGCAAFFLGSLSIENLVTYFGKKKGQTYGSVAIQHWTSQTARHRRFP